MLDGRILMVGSAALLAGCGQPAASENKAQAVRAPERPGPEAAAERLVRQRLRSDDVRFGQARAYRHDGTIVVCGDYLQSGQARQRFVAVSDIDVWLEPEMRAGEMDRAFAEFCKDGAANA